ncbi:MAG: hypothetical protein K2L72_01575, partial [Clostridia bacterium]|nr:hypothetical protein [Clostridia bacterium]
YTLSATLTGAYYEDGTTVESGVFCAATIFRIYNPVTELRLKAGATVQTASPTDKMSAGWVFEGVRSNGETFPVPSSEITCEGLDTLTAGTRRAVISYGGVTGEIEYTITPRPEIIKDVEVSLKDGINTTVEGDYLTVGVDDFNVNVNADGAYSLTDSWLIYAGQLSKEAVLSAKEEPHELAVRVCFEYAVEGENVTKEFERTVFIKVTKTQPPSEPAEPVGDNLIVDGSVMDGLPKEITGQTLASSAAGNITVVEEKEFTVRVEDCSRTVEGVSFTKAITVEVGDGGFEYSGLRFAIDKAATVRVYIALTDMIGVSIAGMDGENLNILFDDYDCVGEDGAVVEYGLAEGEYCLFALGGTGGKLSVYSMEIIFD